MNSSGNPDSLRHSRQSFECRQEPPIDETPAINSLRRQRITDLDRSACRTRLSHRRFLIRMQVDAAAARSAGPGRNGTGSGSASEFGRQVDWD